MLWFRSLVLIYIGSQCRSNLFHCSNILIIRCGNVNWAKRLKCNVCNTNKPGQNEGGVRYVSMSMISLPLYCLLQYPSRGIVL